MKITNQQFNLEAIPGIQEIDDIVAANYNGGTAYLYADQNYGSQAYSLNGGVGAKYSFSGKGFNDKTSSIRIT